MNLKKLSIEYDRLYGEADKLFKKHNPCQFKGNKCVYKGAPRTNGCCGSCRHLTPKGCSVKCLGCKTFFCEGNYCKVSNGFLNRLHDLREEASQISTVMLGCYQSKKEFLLYYSLSILF